jgi:hypothetical protein
VSKDDSDDKASKKKPKKGDLGDVGKVVPIKKMPGPLGPWRLSLSVAVAGLTTGLPLIHAAQTGVQLDLALLRSFGIAFLTWWLLGRINRVLIQAALDRAASPTEQLATVTEWTHVDTTATEAGSASDASDGRAA